MGTSFLVSSGKGGVGKTQTAINLSTALALFGADVLIVDGNLPTPDVSLYFGIPSDVKTLNDVIRGDAKPEKAIFHHESGLKIMPASVQMNASKGLTQDRIRNVLKELNKYANTLVIDSAPGLGAEVVTAMRASDKAIIVTNPEIPALTDAFKTIQLANYIGAEVVGVILNRTGRYKGELDDATIKATLGDDVPIIGRIPEDYHIPIAALHSKSVVTAFPRSPSALAFKRAAAVLTGVNYIEKTTFWDHLRDILRV
jgi:septum site-determining protein MinD